MLIDKALSSWPGVPAVITCDAFCEAKCLGSLAQEVTIVSTLRVTSAKAGLLMGDLVSSMQTNVREEFSDAPLTCAICQKSKILKNLDCAFTVCPQSFPQEGKEIFVILFSWSDLKIERRDRTSIPAALPKGDPGDELYLGTHLVPLRHHFISAA
jgi:hypothetical protein